MAKKKANQLSNDRKIQLLEKVNKEISLRRQCEILNVNRSSLYYKPKGKNPYDITLEEAITKIHFKYPFYGYRKVTVTLRQMGFHANNKKVRRIRNELNICAIYPKINISKSNKRHKKYPYLLKGLEITNSNQVWSTDITYIKIKNKGWVYLVAIIDWYSRYILSFEVSITLEIDFCIQALEDAFKITKPDIFNSDQGSQFTSDEFIKKLESENIQISMDSKGRALDNIIIERFWRSVKYENVYLTEYNSVSEAKKEIKDYINFYNHERIHQSLDYHTPYEIYFGKKILSAKENLKIS